MSATIDRRSGLPLPAARGAADASEAARLPRPLVMLVLTATLVIALVFAGRAVRPALDRPLESLRVDGTLTRTTAAEVAAAADIAPGTPIFQPDLEALRGRIEALPWIGRARVSRLWPNRLVVRVWERAPYAHWGEHGLLDEQGAAFTPPAADLAVKEVQALPQLSGPAGRELDVMHAYEALAQALSGSAFAVDGLALDARGEWRATTTRGIVLRLGSGDPLAHDALLLGTVSRALAAELGRIAAIDLRYGNGFSVDWKNAPPQIAGTSAPVSAAAPASPTSPIAAPAVPRAQDTQP